MAGKAGWQWLFIIEGSIAIAVGIATWLFLPPFPDQIKDGKRWPFTAPDIQLAKTRAACMSPTFSLHFHYLLKTAYNTLDARIELKQILEALKDPKTYFFAFINGKLSISLHLWGSILVQGKS